MAKIVMGYWDCPYCGSQGIGGDTAVCPACGRARGDVKFYMKDHREGETLEADQRAEIEYVDEEKAKYINKNPDWYCSFCNTLNSDNAKFCTSCGASRENSESNYFEMLKKKQAQDQKRAVHTEPAVAPKKSRRPMLLLLVFLLAIVGIFAYMNSNKTKGDLQITSFDWVRRIAVEQNQQFSESDWTLPTGAELTDQRQEYHHSDTVLSHYESVEVEKSRQVLDHYDTYYTYEDMGNGFYEEIPHERPVYRTEYYTETEQQPVYVQVPRYQTKYYYNIWRWKQVRVEEASGQDQQPAWPELDLAEDEREGERSERYRFTVVDKDGQSTTYRLAEADWSQLHPGDNLFITAKRNGADAYITDQDGNRIAQIWQEYP